MADGSTKTVKKTPTTPKVKYNGCTYEIVEAAGNTIRVSDGQEEFCILASDTKPVNKQAREMLKDGAGVRG